MPTDRARAIAAVGAAVSGLVITAMLSIGPAHATPPGFCAPPATVADNVCTARLTSVTADNINGTITGTPVGGGAAVILWGQADAYVKSAGFGATPPDAIGQWDAAIDRVGSADPNGPNWYGNAKARVFLPRSLDELATHFPPNTVVAQFTPDDTNGGGYRIVSIQPLAE